MKPPSLPRNIFALLIMQSINYLIPIITLPYLTRTLGPEQYGALNLALNIIQYGIFFIIFGFNLSTTQYIARHKETPTLISQAFWETISAKLIFFIITCIALTALILTLKTLYEIRFIIFILFGQLIVAALDPIWFFQGIEKLERVSLISSGLRALNIPLLFFLVHSPNDVVLVAGIQVTVNLIVVIINLLLVYNEGIVQNINNHQLNIRKTIKASFPIFIGTAATSLYTTSTPIILGLVNTHEEVGIYAASFKIQIAAIGVFTVLGQAIYPRANSLFATNKKSGYLFIKKLMIYMLPILLIAAILFYAIIPPIAPFLLGEQFSDTTYTLKIMTPMLLFVPYSIVFINNLLLPLGYKGIYYKVPLYVGSAHVIYAFFLSKYLGAIGAAYSILITEIITFMVLFYLVLKLTKLPDYWSSKY